MLTIISNKDCKLIIDNTIISISKGDEIKISHEYFDDYALRLPEKKFLINKYFIKKHTIYEIINLTF